MPNRAEFLVGTSISMTPGEGTDVLKSHGWLSDRPTDFQDGMLGICRWRLFEAGESLVVPGDSKAALIGIACGTAAIVTALGPPDTPLTHISHLGWWVGYVPLIAGRPTDNATVARTSVYAAVASRSAVDALLTENPSWWRHIARLALYYGEVAANIVADLLIRESDRRCAATLLRIADCRFSGDEPKVAFTNQSDVAAIANLSRNTTNALLKAFEQKRLVARKYNHIEVLNPPMLRAIADGEAELVLPN